MLLIIEVILP